jgi:hypothetical protein
MQTGMGKQSLPVRHRQRATITREATHVFPTYEAREAATRSFWPTTSAEGNQVPMNVSPLQGAALSEPNQR